jgi:NAD(P)-dependent dehydrogenase (short-subunit alcohol dehydrogenase family)
MGALEGRIAIITGAGRGVGREHALLFAAEGARVVVNDPGGTPDGEGADSTPADAVVDEIRAAGGEAVASYDDVADWDGAQRMVETALREFGDLHVLVNNAGILRDKLLVSMAPEDFDAVVRVHLRGHFCPTRHAAAYWRAQSKAGAAVKAAVVNTSSAAGLYGNPGQANYAAAKAGIVALTIVAALELERYGVRVNAIAPVARTRLTEDVPVIGELIKAPDAPDAFDAFDPANISPLVASLAAEDCPVSGQVYSIHGGRVERFEGWQPAADSDTGARRTVGELVADLAGLGERTPPAALF